LKKEKGRNKYYSSLGYSDNSFIESTDFDLFWLMFKLIYLSFVFKLNDVKPFLKREVEVKEGLQITHPIKF